MIDLDILEEEWERGEDSEESSGEGWTGAEETGYRTHWGKY